MTFTLDTSGAVAMHAEDNADSDLAVWWSDLTPFCQGYVEALLASMGAAYELPSIDRAFVDYRLLGFSDLAPEALALILRDCEGIGFGRGKFYDDTQRQGGHFWADRQRGVFVNFPPQVPYLSDDGKVCLREVSPASPGRV